MRILILGLLVLGSSQFSWATVVGTSNCAATVATLVGNTRQPLPGFNLELSDQEGEGQGKALTRLNGVDIGARIYLSDRATQSYDLQIYEKTGPGDGADNTAVLANTELQVIGSTKLLHRSAGNTQFLTVTCGPSQPVQAAKQ